MWNRATILSRTQLSPTVTGLKLRIDHHHQPTNAINRFTFLPGQWVDFRPLPSSTWNPPNGGKIIGGYSITSISQSLPQLELVIKTSRHPVAKWATCHAQPGDIVDVRVGGTFTYHNQEQQQQQQVEQVVVVEGGSSTKSCTPNRLLFIAGGVGINPLFSMIQQWHVDQKKKKNHVDSRAVLLYSSGAAEDFLFRNRLEDLIDEKPDRFRVVCTTTQNQKSIESSSSSIHKESEVDNNGSTSGIMNMNMNIVHNEGRIDSSMISEAISWLNKKSDNDNSNASGDDDDDMPSNNNGGDVGVKDDNNNMIADAVFVCGPPGMPESITKILSEEKLVQSTDNIHFEKWW